MATLRQVSALSLIAQTRSFTRAAERLFITQSAVSGMIRDLEEEVGSPLVTRGRDLRLTAAGERLERAGARAQHEIGHAIQEIQGKAAWTQEVVRLAAGSLSAASLIPKALTSLARTHPDISVVVVDQPVARVADLVLSGDADVAIGAASSHSKLTRQLRLEPIFSDRMCVVGQARGPLGGLLQRKQVSFSTLSKAAWILVGPPGGASNSYLKAQLAKFEDSVVAHEVQLYSTAVAMARDGLGLLMLPRFATLDLHPDAFIVRPLRAAGYRWTVDWIARKEPDSPGRQALLEALRGAYAGKARAASKAGAV